MSQMFQKTMVEDGDISVDFVPNLGASVLNAPLLNAPTNVPPAGLLTSFHAVADALSMTHAATVLCLPASMVNQQIARLEALLDVELFDRTARHLRLSPSGRRLYDQLSTDLDQLRNQASLALRNGTASNDFLTLGRADQPVLRIESRLWGLVNALRPYRDILQDLPYQLDFMPAGQGQGDVICYLGKNTRAGYDCTPLFREELRAYGAANYPTPAAGFSPDQLLLEPRLELGHELHQQDWAIFLGQNPNTPLPGLRKEPYTNFSHFHRALKGGRGVGVGLSALFMGDVMQNNLKIISPHSVITNRACFLGVRENSAQKDHAQDFAMVLEEIFTP